MMDKRSIEEQVAELTEQQKDTVLKVAKYGTIATLCIPAPFIVFSLLGLITMILDPLKFTDEAMIGFYIVLAIGVLIAIGINVFIKIWRILSGDLSNLTAISLYVRLLTYRKYRHLYLIRVSLLSNKVNTYLIVMSIRH